MVCARLRFAVLSILGLSVALAGTSSAEVPNLVPTHPRLTFRKDDLPKLRRKCLTTHAGEYARLKAGSDASAFLETNPVAPGLLFQLTNESRYRRYAESDYDAFHEVLDPQKARALANDILYRHRRSMSARGTPYLAERYTYYLSTFWNRAGVLTVFGDDVPLARTGELEARLKALAENFRDARQVYNAVAYRRGGKATSFH